MLKRLLFAPVIFGVALYCSLAQAQPLQCDTVYTVEPGDSLSKIAGRTYGRTTAYQPIFDYNPGVLTSPNTIPVGAELYLPCLEQDGGEDVADLAPLTPSQSADIRVLTGSEYPPYVDAGLPEGGFSFELVERAMQYADAPADYRIDVINDWSAHLQPLLSDGLYDLGFPWFRPDCSQLDRLGENSVWRCKNLRFSEALHEVVVTFFGRSGEVGEITVPGDANGLTICRPRGYFTHDLEVMGLVPPAVILVAGANPTDCFERLVDGEVDLVTVNADTADNVITELAIREEVEEVINLATIQTLHVVGLKTNPDTRPRLLRVNKGLLGLRDEGTFRSIAEKHLTN